MDGRGGTVWESQFSTAHGQIPLFLFIQFWFPELSDDN